MVDTAAETITESIRCAVRFPLRLREALLRASFRTLESLRPYLRFPVTPVHPPYTVPNATIRLWYDVLHEIQKNAGRNRPENRTGAERKIFPLIVDRNADRLFDFSVSTPAPRPPAGSHEDRAAGGPTSGTPQKEWTPLQVSPSRRPAAGAPRRHRIPYLLRVRHDPVPSPLRFVQLIAKKTVTD